MYTKEHTRSSFLRCQTPESARGAGMMHLAATVSDSPEPKYLSSGIFVKLQAAQGVVVAGDVEAGGYKYAHVKPTRPSVALHHTRCSVSG